MYLVIAKRFHALNICKAKKPKKLCLIIFTSFPQYLLNNRSGTNMFFLTWVWVSFSQSAHFSSAGFLRVSVDWGKSVQLLETPSESSCSDLCRETISHVQFNILYDTGSQNRCWSLIALVVYSVWFMVILTGWWVQWGWGKHLCGWLWFHFCSGLCKKQNNSSNTDMKYFCYSILCVCFCVCVWLKGLTVNAEQWDLEKCPCQFVECGCAESFCWTQRRIYCFLLNNMGLSFSLYNKSVF